MIIQIKAFKKVLFYRIMKKKYTENKNQKKNSNI